MRRVDFLGGQGVGKSYLFGSLAGAGRRDFLTMAEAVVRAAAAILAQRGSFRHGLLHLILRAPLPLAVRLDMAGPIVAHYGDAFFSDAVALEAFASGAIELSSTARRPALQRMKGQQWLFRSVRDVVVLERVLPRETVVVTDESLCKKVYEAVSPDDDAHEERAARYFERAPVPVGLCHFHCALDETMRRVKWRASTEGRLIPDHRTKDDNVLRTRIMRQAKIARIGRDILERRGAQVLDVDTAQPSAANLRELRTFLRQVGLAGGEMAENVATRPAGGAEAIATRGVDGGA